MYIVMNCVFKKTSLPYLDNCPVSSAIVCFGEGAKWPTIEEQSSKLITTIISKPKGANGIINYSLIPFGPCGITVIVLTIECYHLLKISIN